MQERKLYEYAVIRVVPRVDRQEFVNVGVILFSKEASFLKMKFEIAVEKIQVMDPDAEMASIAKALNAFECVCNGTSLLSPIARLSLPERFRWLTAKRSTMIQTSAVHSGYGIDLDRELLYLFDYLVK